MRGWKEYIYIAYVSWWKALHDRRHVGALTASLHGGMALLRTRIFGVFSCPYPEYANTIEHNFGQNSLFRGMRVCTWKMRSSMYLTPPHHVEQQLFHFDSRTLVHPHCFSSSCFTSTPVPSYTHAASSAFNPYDMSSHTTAQPCQPHCNFSGIKVNCLWCFFVSCWRAVSTTDRFAPNELLLLTNCCCFVCTVCCCHVCASYMTSGAL